MKGSSNKDSNKMFGEVCFGRAWFGTRNVEFDITALSCSSVHARSYPCVNVNCLLPHPSSGPVREGIFLSIVSRVLPNSRRANKNLNMYSINSIRAGDIIRRVPRGLALRGHLQSNLSYTFLISAIAVRSSVDRKLPRVLRLTRSSGAVIVGA